MAIKDLNFLNFDKSGEVNGNLEFTINPDDFTIVSSTIARRAKFVTETGSEIDTHAELILGNNTAIVHIPDTLQPGKYGFGILLADLVHPDARVIVSTPLDAITIRDKDGSTRNTPIIEMARFQGGQQVIKATDLPSTSLIVTGLYLDSIKECRLSSLPSVVFNIILKTADTMTLRVVNAPFISAGEHIARVSFRYEMINELGIMLEQGFVAAPQNITIVGE